jgi:hypothetical protein
MMLPESCEKYELSENSAEIEKKVLKKFENLLFLLK